MWPGVKERADSVLQPCVSADGDTGFLFLSVHLRCSVISEQSLITLDVMLLFLKKVGRELLFRSFLYTPRGQRQAMIQLSTHILPLCENKKG